MAYSVIYVTLVSDSFGTFGNIWHILHLTFIKKQGFQLHLITEIPDFPILIFYCSFILEKTLNSVNYILYSESEMLE